MLFALNVGNEFADGEICRPALRDAFWCPNYVKHKIWGIYLKFLPLTPYLQDVNTSFKYKETIRILCSIPDINGPEWLASWREGIYVGF